MVTDTGYRYKISGYENQLAVFLLIKLFINLNLQDEDEQIAIALAASMKQAKRRYFLLFGKMTPFCVLDYTLFLGLWKKTVQMSSSILISSQLTAMRTYQRVTTKMTTKMTT